MRTKISLAEKILNALQVSSQNTTDPILLTESDIAKFIHGDSYVKQTATIFNQQIKQNIFLAKELANDNGLFILTEYCKNKATGEINGRIAGWRLFNLTNEEHILKLRSEAEFKQKNVMARARGVNKIVDFAKSHNLPLGMNGLHLLAQ